MTDIFDARLYELMPEPMRKLPKVRALSYTFWKASQRTKSFLEHSMVRLDIDSLDISVVDALAAEIEAPYYDDTADDATKRQTLKDAILNYKEAGTPAAVDRMVETVFTSGKVIEWFENDADPYTFEIETGERFTPETAARVERILRSVKNVRSVLTSITGVRDVEAAWKHLFGNSWDDKQVLPNDVNINEPDQAYPVGEFFGLGEVSELLEDIVLFRKELEREAELPLYIGFAEAADSLSVIVETLGETEMTEGIYAGGAVVQDTISVLQ